MYFITRATPINSINGKAINGSINGKAGIKKQLQLFDQSYKVKLNHASSYLWLQRCNTHIIICMKSDFKKPGTHQPVTGAPGLIKGNY